MTVIKPERRLIEIRAVSNEENKMLVEGYAITYNAPATHQYGRRKFTETIRRGALDKTDMKDVPMRYNHNDNIMIMARTRNKSLKLIKDDTGLKIQANLLDTQSNRDLYKAIQEGLIDKMSFAFSVADGGDSWIFGEEETIREVHNIDRLYDVSAVDTPFYDSTSIYARSLELLDGEEKRLEGLRKAEELEIMKLKIKMKGKV
ncbi:HK97 family phage prohead protease [Bacteroides sp.]|uniref:HK97 family phage prohead protease n=1 Tax=Bacteroides sp. TaxID=29523 RepID=UPI002612FCA1|nr:HK97 family phage prohead protease [Bacteroides sp.]MDD3040783.1 HK97 family phage prohead protease [Bacteroides sp.]